MRRIYSIHDRYYNFRSRKRAPNGDYAERKIRQWGQELEERKPELQGRVQNILDFLGSMKKKSKLLRLTENEIKRLLQEEKQFTASTMGEPRPLFRPMDARRSLLDFVSREHRDRQGKPVRIKLGRVEDIGTVHMDPNLLFGRGLSNLTDDAIMHSQGSPEVEISLRSGRGKNEHTYRTSVVNRGPELSPQDLAAIGNRRWTQHPKNRRRGYGKISANLIAKAHGGRLDVRNSRRNGRHYGPRLTLVARKHPRAA